MKLKRYKQAAKTLAFYAANFGLAKPYSVLADGTFLQAARVEQVSTELLLVVSFLHTLCEQNQTESTDFRRRKD